MKKVILDASCGPKMMWFDKHNPNTIYIDIRKESKGFIKEAPNIEINPDIIMDFTNLKFKDNTFKLVILDPPHLKQRKCIQPILKKKYGGLNVETWPDDILKGFKECWRVLDDYGILLFKWSSCDIKLKTILKIIPEKPLISNCIRESRSSSTFWLCFMKIPKG